MLLWAVGYSGQILAHEQMGSLGKDPDAKDIYYMTCSGGDGTTLLQAAVIDLPPVKQPRVLVRVWRSDVAVAAVDPVDGDTDYSVFTTRRGGSKVYGVSVSKLPRKAGMSDSTRAEMETYNLSYHCSTGPNHTPTDIRIIQNQ